MKVVINRCYGGFGVSLALLSRALKENKTSLLETWKYGDNNFTHNWDTFVKDNLTEKHGKYKTNHWGHYLYDEKNKILYSYNDKTDRHDPNLVELVEAMGEKANGEHAALSVVEIPDDVKYIIEEYDGIEWVAEEHRTWR